MLKIFFEKMLQKNLTFSLENIRGTLLLQFLENTYIIKYHVIIL